MKKLIKKHVVAKEESLMVSDSRLAQVIAKKFEIKCIFDPDTMDLFRGLRTHMFDLVWWIETMMKAHLTDKGAR